MMSPTAPPPNRFGASITEMQGTFQMASSHQNARISGSFPRMGGVCASAKGSANWWFALGVGPTGRQVAKSGQRFGHPPTGGVGSRADYAFAIRVTCRALPLTSEHPSSPSRRPGDSTIDLCGCWHIRSDPGNVGLAETWFSEPLREPPWRAVEVSGAWQRDLGTEFHTIAWYRRRITLPEEWRWSRTLLHFEAVATHAAAWVNGRRIGSHCGDYIPFEFDLSAQAAPGSELELVIRVDEMPGHITKGFHDMLSLHHGGLWQPLRLLGCGALHARPDGVAIVADAATGEVRTAIELDRPAEGDGRAIFEIRRCGSEQTLAQTAASIERGGRGAAAVLRIDSPAPWSPNDPALYEAHIQLIDAAGQVESHTLRFGFRSLRIDGTRILLNDSPIHLRGVLHWGHEPQHMAPAPTPEQAREEFETLRAMGFNCICLCMWYPPRWYFDLANETGMMIWQEHPNWHAPMEDELLPEYQRLYSAFLRRDRNHPSVVIVSATCEHPCFHPRLAQWWWEQARAMLPGKLLQVQTASFAWADHERTDLHDEHTYDNNDRWVTYLADLQDTLAALPVKPFVMGETIAFSSWPDFEAMAQAVGGKRPWWLPAIFESGRRFERELTERYGREVVESFRAQSIRHHLLGRKFQIERFREYPNHAGIVMNHLRDVPACICGFKDDLDRWRFTPEQMRGWLADAPLILRTPGHRRSFVAGTADRVEVLLSNFGRSAFDGEVRLSIEDPRAPKPTFIERGLRCAPGEVARVEFDVHWPAAEGPRPQRVRISAQAPSLEPNAWDLWLFPATPNDPPQGVYRLEGLPFEPADAEPDELERGYSRGFGLPVKRWKSRLPDPARLAPHLPAWRLDEPIPSRAHTILTHRLTHALIDFMTGGGRVVLLASKARGGLGTCYEWFFGQCPLVIEEPPLTEGDSEWIVDLLGMDLTRTYARLIPVDDLGLVDCIDPLVRCVYTHDQRRPRLLDMLLHTRVGKGMLTVSSLDHSDPAGRYLLERLITGGEAECRVSLAAEALHRFVV